MDKSAIYLNCSFPITEIFSGSVPFGKLPVEYKTRITIAVMNFIANARILRGNSIQRASTGEFKEQSSLKRGRKDDLTNFVSLSS
jgi:hypothetical protein